MKSFFKISSFITISLLSGCGLLKSEYEPIRYYRLMAPAPANRSAVLPGTLMVRTFYTNAQYDSDDIFTTAGGAIVGPYEYHKWVSATPELVTDFIINRLSSQTLFANGVVPSGSASSADYILEGKVIDMLAETDERGTNVAHLQMQVSLIRFRAGNAENSLLMQKRYDKRIQRANATIPSIAEAMSQAMAEITDEMAGDIATAIRSGGR
ncbi:MAG TPA: ABC-type transport auxiliary lipoprotein family protein [Patescibacteria group bacterium]|nr:ABC-type transport auxiliary lipoprotein family protein [Patescibacteria group bacterium]